MKSGKHLNISISESNLKAALDKLVIPLIVGLFVTILGGLVLNSITQEAAAPNDAASDATVSNDISVSEEMKEILTSIQKLSIGSSKYWVDDKLGPPYAENIVEITENGRVWPHTDESSKVGEILECIYIFDIVSVKMYFDTAENSCKAFFVTLMENTCGIDVDIPGAYSFFVSDKPLGKFTFSDIGSGYEPNNIYGYASNGVGRVFYGEQYYFAGSGNYQNFYFAVLDYGEINSLSEFDHFVSTIQHDINSVSNLGNGKSALSSSDFLVEQRHTLYVNTYGISVLNTELTFSLFSTYIGFDSASFRKWN